MVRIRKEWAFLLGLFSVVACQPMDGSNTMSSIKAELCDDNIVEVGELMAVKDYRMAEIKLNAAEEVHGCDSAEFKSLQTEVLLAKLGSPPDQDQNATTKSAWRVSSDTSNMTDEKSVLISTLSEPYRHKFGTTQATLAIRCLENTTSVVWNWDEYLGDDDDSVYSERKRMTLRLDSEAPQEKWYTVSTSKNAVGLWSGGDAIPFVRKLANADRLVARITPYGENPREAVFDVSGLNEHLPELQQACNWG